MDQMDESTFQLKIAYNARVDYPSWGRGGHKVEGSPYLHRPQLEAIGPNGIKLAMVLHFALGVGAACSRSHSI